MNVPPKKSAPDLKGPGDLLSLIQSLPKSPVERQDWGRDRLTQLASKVRECGEVELSRLDELPDLISNLERYFTGRSLDGALDCLMVYAVHRARIYKVAGTFEAFGKRLGIAKGTLYHWLHRGELVVRICEECPGLALPEEINTVRTIRKLPEEHWVGFWHSVLKHSPGVDPGPAVLAKALEEYRVDHGLRPPRPGKQKDTPSGMDRCQQLESEASIEDFDRFQNPSRAAAFRILTDGLSPSRTTAVDISTLSLLHDEDLSRAKEIVAKLADTNPEDWDLFLRVSVPVFLKQVGVNLEEFGRLLEQALPEATK